MRGTLGTIHGGPAWAHQNRNAQSLERIPSSLGRSVSLFLAEAVVEEGLDRLQGFTGVGAFGADF